jgi:hypothetical protein
MKPFRIAALCLAFALPALAADQDVAQLEFIRALKSEYGPRLADDYLKRLQQQSPGEFKPRLALEAALIKLELAEKAPTASERMRLTREAETAIKGYNGPEAGLTKIKILNLQARALRLKAQREDDNPEAYEKTKAQALSLLQEVARQLDATATQLTGDIAKTKDANEKKALEQALIQAEFDLGVNAFERAELSKFDDNGALQSAKGKFEQVIAKKTVDPPLSVRARAWLGRYMEHAGSDQKMEVFYSNIEKDGTPGGDAGRAEAAYFHLLYSGQAVTSARFGAISAATIEKVQALGDIWLKNYGNQAAAAEIAGTHYVLAMAAYERANLDVGKIPASEIPKRKALYEEARKHFREVERTDNDYSGKARRSKLQCFVILQGWSKDVPLTEAKKLKNAAADVPLQKLTTFEDLLDRAQFEIARLGEKLREPGIAEDKIPELRADAMKRSIDALQAAIALGTTKESKVPADELVQARLMLTYAYLGLDDGARTVENGQKLVEENVPQAADAAIYVLQGYSSMLRKLNTELEQRSKAVQKAQDKEEQQKAAKLRDETATELKKRTEDFYAFMNKVVSNWPDEQAADIARHQQGMLLYNERKFPQAIAKLAQVRPDYAAYTTVRFQLAVIAWNSAADDDKPTPDDPEKRSLKDLLKMLDGVKLSEYWKARALVVVIELQAPPAGADPSSVEYYIRAKMMLASPYYEADKFKEMDAIFPPLLANVQSGALVMDKEARADVQPSLLECVLLAAYGRAATKVDPKTVKFQETRPLFDPVMPLILDPQTGAATDVMAALMKPTGKDPAKDAHTVKFRDTFMEAIMRAYLLDGKGVEAAKLLRALTKFYPDKDAKDEPSDGGAAQIGGALFMRTSNDVADLRAAAKIAEIEGKKDVAAAKKSEADKLTAGVASFLDDLAKDPKALKPEYNRLLAKGFVAIDQPAKAIPLIQNDPGAPAAGAPAEKVRAYAEERVLYVRCLRETKNLDGADKAFADLQKQDAALVGAKQPPIFADDVYYLIEECRLLDAHGKHEESVKKWKAVTQKLSGKLNHTRTEKELYFDCYCGWVFAFYKVAAAIEDDDKRAETVQLAAQKILRVEERWPDFGGDVSKARFLMLLESTPPLKEAYTKLKTDKKGS